MFDFAYYNAIRSQAFHLLLINDEACLSTTSFFCLKRIHQLFVGPSFSMPAEPVTNPTLSSPGPSGDCHSSLLPVVWALLVRSSPCGFFW